jgi:lipocalin
MRKCNNKIKKSKKSKKKVNLRYPIFKINITNKCNNYQKNNKINLVKFQKRQIKKLRVLNFKVKFNKKNINKNYKILNLLKNKKWLLIKNY